MTRRVRAEHPCGGMNARGMKRKLLSDAITLICRENISERPPSPSLTYEVCSALVAYRNAAEDLVSERRGDGSIAADAVVRFVKRVMVIEAGK